MPFSSPMGEEILSPVSPSFAPDSSTSQRNSARSKLGNHNTNSRKRFSAQKFPKVSSPRTQEKSEKNSRWPGLNVVTNFSKPPILAQRAAGSARRDSRGSHEKIQNARPGFVTISDIKPPTDKKGDRGFKTHTRNKSSVGTMRSDLELRNHNEAGEKSKYDPADGATVSRLPNFDDPPDYDACLLVDIKARENTLKPSPTKLTELSPSDRPIVIGISIPSARLAEHSISPDVGPTPLTPYQSAIDRDAPATPTIVVTPAREDGPWSTALAEQNTVPSGRRRVASSVYSRATHYGRGWSPRPDVPPIPAHPQAYISSKETASKSPVDENESRIGPHSREDSTDTIFDEDDQVVPYRRRPASGESHSQNVKRSSTDTVARPLSHGWWNYVLSPFTTRSNTMMFRGGSPNPAGSIPSVPSPYQGALSTREQQAEELKVVSSPLSSKSSNSHDNSKSLDTDHGWFETPDRTVGLALDNIPGSNTNLDRPQEIGKLNMYNSPVPFEGFGAAAEYFDACWHDQNSPTPYFNCQNHSCPLSNYRSHVNSDRPSHVPEDLDSSRGLPEAKNDGQALSRGFEQTPANRFSAAFGQSIKQKPRALSEATDIEDLDETPAVHEAFIAPVVRAGAPVTAASVNGTDAASAVVPDNTALNAIAVSSPPSRVALANTPAPESITQACWPYTAIQQPLPTVRGMILREMNDSSQISEPALGNVPAYSSPTSQTAQKRFVAIMPPEDEIPAQDHVKAGSPILSGSQSPITYPRSAPSASTEPLPSSEASKPFQTSTSSNIESSNPPRSSGYEHPRTLPASTYPSLAVPLLRDSPISSGQPPSAGMTNPISRGAPQIVAPNFEGFPENELQSGPHTYIVNNYYDESGPRRHHGHVTLADLGSQARSDDNSESNWVEREKVTHHSREGKSQKSRNRTCFKRHKRPMTNKNKRLLWGIAVSLVILIILILALAMTLTRKGDKLDVQSQWLNITGFPPIPTGISTIVQPDAVHESSACVQPATMWSCALPKEDQDSIAPNDPDQPNFRVEIRFRNGTANSTSSTKSNPNKRSETSAFNQISARSLLRRHLLQVRDTFTNNLFTPSPSPPSDEDQIFLGNSTDKNAAPFNGESTPFFISFLSASKLPQQRRLLKRQKSKSKNTTDPFPDITKGIPPPDTNPDGTVSPANLLPHPTAQPLRLYDRGLPTEHYGFYTYYDRSIFLKSTSLANDTGPVTGEVPDDQTGGSLESSATVRCTWRQTRFLVQIWTNPTAAGPLILPSTGNSTSTTSHKPKNPHPRNLTESSANDFIRPGSFPYPVTITLDRHGGSLDQKFIFCYAMDNREHIIADAKKIQLEDRGAGGTLVNPAQGPFGNVNVTRSEGGPGGIDGGSGGCECQWRNFEAA